MASISRTRWLMGVSAVLRVILVAYGEWQDAHMDVHYTDIDYLVFSDAASLMASNRSPYERATYRYSPLLALILMPNSFLHHCWGKLLFSASGWGDPELFIFGSKSTWNPKNMYVTVALNRFISTRSYQVPRRLVSKYKMEYLLVGHLIDCILSLRGVPEKQRMFCVGTWLFNPFTFTVATRGNCEPIVCAMILWILISLMKRHVVEAAIWYGLVVHLRIYPIIYVLPILIVLDTECFDSSQTPCLSTWNTKQCRLTGNKALHSLVTKGRSRVNLWLMLKEILNKQRILFGLFSGAVFFLLTCIFYCLYGQQFLDEALLYHLTRTDPRHNFSIYFYHIYLHHEHEFTMAERLMTFGPQFLVQLVLILFFAEDLPFCLFAQTVTFVAFNKVITAQYFVWFFCLLPLILPWTRLNMRWKGFLCIGLWAGAQVHWLGWAYLLEFKGKNVFVQLWLASIVFLAATTCVLGMILVNHKFCPLFQHKVLATDYRGEKKTD